MDKNENDPAMPPPSYPDLPKEDMTLHLLPGEPIQSRKRYTANQMIAYGIHCADVALAASQQPAEQAQGQAAAIPWGNTDARYIAQQRATARGDGELPPLPAGPCSDTQHGMLYTGRQMKEYARAALAQRAGSAPSPHSIGYNDDLPEGWKRAADGRVILPAGTIGEAYTCTAPPAAVQSTLLAYSDTRCARLDNGSCSCTGYCAGYFKRQGQATQGPDWRLIAEGHALEAVRLQAELDAATQQSDSERDAARAGINPVFVLPVSVAVLIDQAFLPSNPNKLRAAREDVKDAAKIYKSSLAAMLARLAAQQGEKGGE